MDNRKYIGMDVHQDGQFRRQSSSESRSRGIMEADSNVSRRRSSTQAFVGAAGSSLPPQLQRFVATKKTVGLGEWCAQPSCSFTVAGEFKDPRGGTRLICDSTRSVFQDLKY
jgi:hypothetical protein